MTLTTYYISTHHHDRSVGLALRSRRNMSVPTTVVCLINMFLSALSTVCLEDGWLSPSGRPTVATHSTRDTSLSGAPSRPSRAATTSFTTNLSSHPLARRHLLPPPPPLRRQRRRSTVMLLQRQTRTNSPPSSPPLTPSPWLRRSPRQPRPWPRATVSSAPSTRTGSLTHYTSASARRSSSAASECVGQ